MASEILGNAYEKYVCSYKVVGVFAIAQMRKLSFR